MVFRDTVATVLVSINGHSQKQAVKLAKRLFGAGIYDVIAEAEIETILIGGRHPLIPKRQMPSVRAYLRRKIEKSINERNSKQVLIADYCTDEDDTDAIARSRELLRLAQEELRSWESMASVDVQVTLLDHKGEPIGIAA
ncbi:MAG: hypothetical protein V4644_00320 [Patescibacteria group bacterium]